MSNAAPKVGRRNGKVIHYSVGAIITNTKSEILLTERAQPPPGFAGLAGHLDEGEGPKDAMIREAREESGINIDNVELIAEEFIPWNWCHGGVTGHHWYLFKATGEGEPVGQPGEVKSIAWHPVSDLKKLELEEVWQYWFKKLGYLS